MMAVETVLSERGYYLDLLGRSELLEVILDDAEAGFTNSVARRWATRRQTV
jgi:hypothetical protein